MENCYGVKISDNSTKPTTDAQIIFEWKRLLDGKEESRML